MNIANSAADSVRKRVNLVLRWHVRREGPVEKRVVRALGIPLSLHVGRTVRRLGLLGRETRDRKAVGELTSKLRDFCAEDSVKYDLALFGMGIGGRRMRWRGLLCSGCAEDFA